MEKVKISTNCYRGHPITNPMDLIELAKNKESVYIKGYCFGNSNSVKAAVMVLNMQTRYFLNLIKNKKIYFIIK